MEDRVTKFLSDKAEEQSVTIGEVTIRIVSSSDKYTMVKQSFKERFVYSIIKYINEQKKIPSSKKFYLLRGQGAGGVPSDHGKCVCVPSC